MGDINTKRNRKKSTYTQNNDGNELNDKNLIETTINNLFMMMTCVNQQNKRKIRTENEKYNNVFKKNKHYDVSEIVCRII